MESNVVVNQMLTININLYFAVYYYFVQTRGLENSR
jgi:hypothetical protein